MELSNLIFKVDTSQLEKAVKTIEQVGQATEDLAKNIQNLARAEKQSADASTASAKARQENAKATTAELKAAEAQTKAAEKAAKATKDLGKSAEETGSKLSAAEKLVEKMNLRQQVLARGTIELNNEVVNLGRGFTSGQAAMIASLKQLGGGADMIRELATTLKQYNDITGVNPFDKAIGGMRKLTQEARELQLSSDLSAKGFALTKDQVQILARDLQALTSVYKQNGASQDYVNRAIDVVTKRFIRKAEVVNRLNAEVKENERAAKAQGNAAINAAKATSFIERELARAENALQGLNEQLYISTSNRLLKFQQSLAASNLPMEQQIALMERYKKTLADTDAQRRKQNTADSNRQVDLLARSLAPQISDVAVSLAGGMNPFTVLMQQGLQVRDLMQLSGVEAERMGEAFRKAGAGMVSTSVAAAKAIGSMLVGSLVDAGNAITSLFLKTITLGQLDRPIEVYARAMSIAATNAKGLEGILLKVGSGALRLVPIFAGIGAASVIGGIIALGVALKQIIEQENELNRVVTMNGAALGVTYDGAYTLAKAYGEVNGKTTEAITVMQEMAKAGNLTSGSFTMIADASIAMSKATGASIAEVVKKFSDLAKEPTKVLTEIAIQTGYIDAETLKLVRSLEASGDKAAAAAIALKAYGDASKQSADTVMQNYGYLTKFAIGAKEIFASMWDALLGIGRTGTLSEQVSKAQEAFDAAAKRYKANSDDLFTRQQYESAELELLSLKKKLEAEKKLGEQRAINSSLAGLDSRLGQYELKNRTEYQKKTDQLINDEKELLALKAKGVNVDDRLLIVQREKARLEKEYLDSLSKANKEKTPKVGGRASAPKDDTLSFYESALKTFTSNAEKAEQAQENLTVSQKKFIEMTNDPRWEALNATRRMEIRNAFAAAQASEAYQKALEDENKKRADAVRLRNEQAGQFFKELEQMQTQLRMVQEEGNMLEYEASLVGLVSDERQKLIAIKRVQLELDKEIAAINASSLTNEQKSAKIDVANATAQQKIANINTKVANDLNQKMVDGVTDAIMTGLLEGGEAGKKKLRDLIVAELQKPVKMFIQATVSNIFGLNGGQQGGGINWTEMAGKAWDWFSGGSTASSAYSLGSAAGSGFGVTTTGSGFGVTASGSGLTASAVTKTAAEVGMQAGSAAGTSAGTAAAAVPIVGWIAAAVMVADSMYKKGHNRTALGVGEGEKKTYGRFSSTSGRTDLQQSSHYKYSAENAARGLLDGLGLSKKWADIFSGTVRMAHLFGRRLKGYGYQADVRGSDVNVSGYEYYKGGVFRSNKTVTTSVDSRDAENLKQEIERVRSASKGMALALGGSTEAIDAFSGSVKINFKGAETAAEQQERLADGLLQLELEMINAATGANMTKESLKALKEETANLAQQAGYSAEQITSTLVAGMTGKMTESEVGAALGDIIVGSIYNSLAMGFAEQITGAITGLIIQPIMTAVLTGGSVTAAVSQASMDAVLATATKAINAFNQIISTAEFKDFIGRVNNLVGGIAKISVKPAANVRSFGSAMQSAGNAAAEAAKKIADERYQLEGKLLDMLNQTAKLRQRELNALHPSNRALQMHIYALEDAKNAYDAVVDAVNDTLDKSKELKDRIKGIFDLLLEQIRELRGEVEDPAEMQRVEAQRLLEGVISSGVLPDQEDLSRAIDALRSGIVDENFQSEVEAARERLTLANTLDQIKTLADQDLKKTEQDILLLEQQLKVAQDQMNALLGIQTYTYNTEQAVIALQGVIGNYTQAFNNALNAVAGAMTSAPAPVSSGGGGGGGGWSGGGGSSAAAKPAARQWTAQGYWDKNPDLQQYWAANGAIITKGRGWSRDDYLRWHWENVAQMGKAEARQFAKGGAFTNGIVQSPTMFNIGEMGEAGPEAIMPLVNVGGSLGVRAVSGDSDTSKQLEMLSTAVMQLTIATNKMQRQFDNARGEDGTSLNVTIVNTSSNPVPTDAV